MSGHKDFAKQSLWPLIFVMILPYQVPFTENWPLSDEFECHG